MLEKDRVNQKRICGGYRLHSLESDIQSLENSDAGRAGNGIRFDSTENMFIADYKGHNILHYNMIWVLIVCWKSKFSSYHSQFMSHNLWHEEVTQLKTSEELSVFAHNPEMNQPNDIGRVNLKI